jgi:hypothetical protein
MINLQQKNKEGYTMGDKEKLEIEKNVIGRYENIKSIVDSAIFLLNKAGKYEADVFDKSMELTEQIQIEIEEIRDLLVDLEEG